MPSTFGDIAGRGRPLLGRSAHPAEVLTAEQHRLWDTLGGRCVRIGTTAGCDVLDVGGTYASWLDNIGADFVILRPDFYVAATAADATQLRSHLDTVLRGLHLTPGGRTTATAA